MYISITTVICCIVMCIKVYHHDDVYTGRKLQKLSERKALWFSRIFDKPQKFSQQMF